MCFSVGKNRILFFKTLAINLRELPGTPAAAVALSSTWTDIIRTGVFSVTSWIASKLLRVKLEIKKRN